MPERERKVCLDSNSKSIKYHYHRPVRNFRNFNTSRLVIFPDRVMIIKSKISVNNKLQNC